MKIIKATFNTFPKLSGGGIEFPIFTFQAHVSNSTMAVANG